MGTHDMGIIISQEINSQKKFWEATYISQRVHSGGCQECTTKEEKDTKKTHGIDGSIQNHGALLDCCFDHSCAL